MYQPERFDAARRALERDRARLLSQIAEREVEIEETRRAAQAAADQASRWTVLQQKNSRTLPHVPAAPCFLLAAACSTQHHMHALCYSWHRVSDVLPPSIHCAEERRVAGTPDPAADRSEAEAIDKALRRQRELERETQAQLESVVKLRQEASGKAAADRDLEEVCGTRMLCCTHAPTRSLFRHVRCKVDASARWHKRLYAAVLVCCRLG
jgi:hypothetical protein